MPLEEQMPTPPAKNKLPLLLMTLGTCLSMYTPSTLNFSEPRSTPLYAQSSFSGRTPFLGPYTFASELFPNLPDPPRESLSPTLLAGIGLVVLSLTHVIYRK